MNKKVKPVVETIETVTGYKTTDGKVFDVLQNAEIHQKFINRNQELYDTFDTIFNNWLEEYQKDYLPFNDQYLEETLWFIVNNLDLDSVVLELQRIKKVYE